MGGRQEITLGSGCRDRGRVIHEIMHALGFYHEHNRPDRDRYIRVLWSNMKKGKHILTIYFYAVNKKGVSYRKQGVSWTKIAFLFKGYTWFRKPNFCVQTLLEQYLEVCFVLFVFLYGGSMRRSQNLKKKLHKALRSVQFLASFISF